MSQQRKHRLIIAAMPVGALALMVLLHSRAAGLAAVGLGSMLLIVTATLLLGARHARRD
jgi:hypothetical protein